MGLHVLGARPLPAGAVARSGFGPDPSTSFAFPSGPFRRSGVRASIARSFLSAGSASAALEYQVEHNEEIIEEVDLETWATRGERPPKARRYIIRIDRERYTVTASGLTGRAILELAGKDPARTLLQQRLHGGGTLTIGPDDFVDFTAPGVERFVTLPRNQTDGDGEARRQFVLGANDTRFLDSTGLVWETIKESGEQLVIIRGRRVVDGYTPAKADIALVLPAGYPDTQIDMAYFCPPLSCGRAVANLSPRVIEGRTYQQWSRHRTPDGPWRAGLDDIASHLALVDYWLERELRGR